MTVPSTTRRAGPFTGTGALVAYPFTFKVFAKEDLAVTIADSDGLETDLVLDSTFTATLNVDQDTTPGGTVNYAVGGVATALPSGYTLAVTGDGLEFEQVADLPQGGNFSPVVIENALDRVVMLLQRLWDGVRRSMRLPDTASDNVSTVLPVPTANSFIGWDSNGTALRNVDPNTLATVVAFAAWQSQAFSGDGVTTAFTLSSDPGNVNNLDVVVGAVPQRNNVDFTLSGVTLTFDVAPANGVSIFARWGQALPQGTSSASAVGITDAAGLYTATDVESALAFLGAYNVQSRTVESFGASTAASAATNSTAIQLALDWLRDNGGHLRFKPGGVYALSAALTCLIDSTPKKLLSRVIDFACCTLDWSASGLTSGILLNTGATSITFLPEFNKQVFRGPLYIKGPQAESGSTKADFNWMNDPDTTVVGIRTQYAQNYLFEAITVSNCFIGRQRFWTWDDTWYNCTFRKHFYGEDTQESCTTGTHIQCAFTYCAMTNLFRVADTSGASVSAQKYISCRSEQSHVWAAFDPGNTSGGGSATDVQFNGIFFDNHYVEGMSDYDLIRVGTKVVDADIITNLTDGSPTFPAGADQDKYTMNIGVTLAKFNHTLTSNSKLFAMPGSGNKCFGFDIVAPAHPINDVRNPNKMQSKRWLMVHSKTNITGQPHEEYSSCRGSMVIDGSGTPPTVLSQNGNLGTLADWPSALGSGGTLATGQYRVSMREDVYSSVFSHNLTGSASGGGAFGTAVVDHANSSRGAVQFTVVDTGGTAFNASRICIQWEGITAEV